MRKLIFLSCVLMFVSVSAFAQYDSSASAASQNEPKTLQGCLSSANGQFALTDNSGKTIWLRGKETASLQSSVGHQIKVTGTERDVTAQSATGNRTSQNDAMSKASDANQGSFLVQSVQDTGTPCSSAGSPR